MVALRKHVSVVAVKAITCTHMCQGSIMRSSISTKHYISMPAPRPPVVKTGQIYCHKRFTTHNIFPVPAFTSVQLAVPRYIGWPQHHFVCYVQGHLKLPPPACPARSVPRYWGDKPDKYNYKNAVNDFDSEAMCVGGSHVRKYSSQEPPVIIESTTIRAVACTYGGSSAV